MWTRDSIKKMRIMYESEFFMTEQQIYKWWWDQTRKRSRKAIKKSKRSLSKAKDQDELLYSGNSSSIEEGEMLVSFQDEFGGYSSRLRINSSNKQQIKQQIQELKDEEGPNVEINLCELLNIDVDKIALQIALGEDPWAEREYKDDVTEANNKEDAAMKNTEHVKTDMKQSTSLSSTSKKTSRSKSDLKLTTESKIIKPTDENSQINS